MFEGCLPLANGCEPMPSKSKRKRITIEKSDIITGKQKRITVPVVVLMTIQRGSKKEIKILNLYTCTPCKATLSSNSSLET